MDANLEVSAGAGATGVYAIELRLPHELSQLFPEWLEANYPLKKARALKAIRSLRAGKLDNRDFSSRFIGQSPRAELIRDRFERACRRHGLASDREIFDMDTSLFLQPELSIVDVSNGTRLSLF